MTARGIRNKNPMNIRRGIDWDGLAEVQPDEDFCTFDEPVMGIRAAAKILLTYQKKYELWTVAGMISRWAPPNENDTDSYIKHVAKAMGVEPDWEIDLKVNPVSFAAMLETMIRHECGDQPYDASVIVRAIDLAMA